MESPKITICIPAYNRPAELKEALESLTQQRRGDWDILVCEDHSPRAAEIAEIVRNFAAEHPDINVHFVANEKNLGYDGNLRCLLDNAKGEYCLYMGDDDILAPGAIERMIDAVSRPNIGVVLRAWKSINKQTGQDVEHYRYFKGDQVFPAGVDAVTLFFRRSVFISGLTVNRQAARKFHTNRFDGSLLYQLYMVARILMEMDGFYISDIIAFRRLGGEHFFGSSENEKGRFSPGQLLPSESVTFVRGFFDIAEYLEEQVGCGIYEKISRDLGQYSYPMLEIQAKSLKKKEYSDYAKQLAGLGLGKYFYFWLYHYSLMLLGPAMCNRIIRNMKKVLGGTPVLGSSIGQAVK